MEEEIFEQSETELTDAELSAGWDDEGTDQPETDETDADTTAEETDEPEAGEATEGTEKGSDTGETEPEEEDKAEDQRFVLRHLDTEHSVTLEEMKTLAQKGLDYDRIREQNESFKKTEGEYAALLKALARHDNTDVDGIVDSLWAGLIAEEDGVDGAVALERAKLRRVQRELDGKKQETEQSAEDKAAEEKRREGFIAFSKAHPDVKAQDIPKEVWDRVNGGMSLLDAYGLHELKELRAENKRLKDKAAAREKEAENAYRTTGSAATSGKNPKPKFDIFAGFDD